jgi:hypothetical protein
MARQRLRLRSRNWIPLLTGICIILGGCSWLATHRSVEMGERFTLRPGASASVKDTDLVLQLDRVGYGWLANGGAHFLFADLTATLNGKSRSIIIEDGKVTTVGNYVIQVLAIVDNDLHPDKSAEDSCELRVTRR